MTRRALILSVLALSGCSTPGSFSVNLRDGSFSGSWGKRPVSAKEPVPEDGPDTTQKFDRDGHPNFGPARL